MQTIKGYKIRIYPTNEQEIELEEYCKASTYCYNCGIAKYREIYDNHGKHTSPNEMCKLLTKFLHDDTQSINKWLSKFKVFALRSAVRNVSKYFKMAYDRIRKGIDVDKAGFPNFIKKKNARTFFFIRKDNMFIYDNYLSCQGFTTRDNNMIYLANHNIPHDKRYNYCEPHIEKDKEGKWWFSCQLKFDNPRIININPRYMCTEPIGIDLGIKDFVTTSYGEKYNYPKRTIFKLEKRRRRQQRRLNKYCNRYIKEAKRMKTKYEDIPKSKNMQKHQRQLNKTRTKLNNIRRNTRYDIANKIIKRNPRAVVMEGLNVTGMLKNHILSPKLQNQGFYEIRRILQYKCEWNDIDFILADRWFPSSKMCSNCGNIKSDLKLHNRIYRCSVCGVVIDRDVNAAINLKNLANVNI